MEALVKGAKWEPAKAIETRSIDFVRLKREEAVAPKERRMPERPPEPEAPPPPRAKLDQALAPPGDAISVSVPKIDTSFKGTGTGGFFNLQTTAVIPLARVLPQYPRQAALDGIEGWVELELDITELGTVENPRVIDSSPRGVFESSALRAIIRWKFKPKVENGVAMPIKRARYTLNFTLAQEEG
jgi:periplasmic protein TonB